MSDTTKSTVAAATASVTTAVQCVLGFTGLGAKLGVERTLVIVAAGVTMVVVIVVWVATVEATTKQRRLVGVGALLGTLALTVTALGVTFAYHNILVRATRVRHETTTSFRGAITPSEAHVEFYTKPATPILLVGYAGSRFRGKSGIERFSDTEFTLHQLSTEKTIVLHHTSAQPVQYEGITDNKVGFTTVREIWTKTAIAAAIGGIVCGGAALFVWWFSASSLVKEKPKPSIGFHTEDEPKTPLRESPSSTSPPVPTTNPTPPIPPPAQKERNSSTTT